MSNNSFEMSGTNKSVNESELLLSGKKYFTDGNLEQALHSFLDVVEKFPENDIAYNNLGVVTCKMGKIKEARLFFKKALEINPRNVNAKDNIEELGVIQKTESLLPTTTKMSTKIFNTESSQHSKIDLNKTAITVGVNFLPTNDANWFERQKKCRESIESLIPLNIVPLNVCYPEEIIENNEWAVLPILKKSANLELKIEGKRKPFVTELFDVISEWSHGKGIPWFCYTNNDIIITEKLILKVHELIEKGYESIVVSRNEVAGTDEKGNLIPGYLEYRGFDVFFFNVDLWRKKRDLYQPYIVGERCWDDAYASVMLTESKGAILYENEMCFHYKHGEPTLDSPYYSYNLSIYNGVDSRYRDSLTAFADEVGVDLQKHKQWTFLKGLVHKHFKKKGKPFL